MALIKCHECGKDVSTEANECPNCGASVQYISHIKWYYWVPILVTVLIVVIVILMSSYPNVLEKELSSDVIDNSGLSKLQAPNKQYQATEEEPKSAEETKADIKSRCSGKWPDDYEMQEYCYNNQMESISNLTSIYQNNPEDSEEHKIMNRCMNKWRDGSTYDFSMVDYCTKNQIESYNRVNK